MVLERCVGGSRGRRGERTERGFDLREGRSPAPLAAACWLRLGTPVLLGERVQSVFRLWNWGEDLSPPQTPAEGFNIRLSVSLGFYSPIGSKKKSGEKNRVSFSVFVVKSKMRGGSGGRLQRGCWPAFMAFPLQVAPESPHQMHQHHQSHWYSARTRGCGATQARPSGSGGQTLWRGEDRSKGASPLRGGGKAARRPSARSSRRILSCGSCRKC